jgi:hypothetical protein
MLFQVYTRPYNIGAGWRRFRKVEADTAAEACDKAYGERVSYENRDGTKDHPFSCNGGASEIMAEVTTIE